MAAELPQPFCELILLAIYFHTLVEKNEKSSIKKLEVSRHPRISLHT